MMLQKSYEFGGGRWIGIIKGKVVKFLIKMSNNKHKIPHIGWNEIYYNKRKFNVSNNSTNVFCTFIYG